MKRYYGTLESNRHAYRVKATPDVLIRLKRIFPAAQQRKGALTLSRTIEHARELEWVLGRWPLEMSEHTRGVLELEAAKHRDQESAVSRILAGHVPPVEAELYPEVEPRDYQLQAMGLCRQMGSLLLADALGLGKTFSAILLFTDPAALPALCVVPTHLPRQWQKAIAKFLPTLRTHITRKGTPYDMAAMREMAGHEPDVIITNYAKLAGWSEHLQGRVKTVVFDEVHELRRPQSQRYDAACRISHAAQMSMGLTATPIYNYGGEAHSVIEVLSPGAMGTREEFTREWGTGMSNGHIKITDPGALGEHMRAEGLMLRRTRKDVGRELGDEPIEVTHTVESDEDIFDAEVGNALELARLIVMQEGTRQDRFQASGDLDWRLRQATGLAKAKYVAGFVTTLLEQHEPVLLMGWHHQVYETWREALSTWEPAWYTGKETAAAKDREAQRFMNGETNLLIMSLRSGAGLDGLQERCRTVVFGELDWSPQTHAQVIGRLYRDGQVDPVLAYYLVSDHGSDPVVADVLELKKQQGQGITDPNAELFSTADLENRIGKLAERYYSEYSDESKLDV